MVMQKITKNYFLLKHLVCTNTLSMHTCIQKLTLEIVRKTLNLIVNKYSWEYMTDIAPVS